MVGFLREKMKRRILQNVFLKYFKQSKSLTD